MVNFKSGGAGYEEPKNEHIGGSDGEMGSFMVAYRLTGESKVKGVCEFVETLVENGAKFLIFAHHKSVMDEIHKFLQLKKIGHVRIDGSVP